MVTHTGAKPFACPECDYRAAQKADLIEHIGTHSNEKPVSCEYCPYKAAILMVSNNWLVGEIKQNPAIHHFTHIGEMPFVSDPCDYSR